MNDIEKKLESALCAILFLVVLIIMFIGPIVLAMLSPGGFR